MPQLTLMSIQTLIQWRLQEGRIHELIPMPRRAPRIRKMYVADRLHLALMEAKPTIEETRRFAQLEADLAVFVNSPTIDPKYLFGLWPPRDRVWEIRSVRPKPSIRVLGRFAAKDEFVAIHYVLREDLGGWNSREWKIEKQRAKTEWTNLFYPYDAVDEQDIHNLVSGAINGKYFYF